MIAFDNKVVIAIKQNIWQSFNEKQGLNEYSYKEFGYRLNKII